MHGRHVEYKVEKVIDPIQYISGMTSRKTINLNNYICRTVSRFAEKVFDCMKQNISW